MLGQRTLRFELPIAAAEFERRLEMLLAKPTGSTFSGELTFTGRVASGLVRVRVRRLSRRASRLRVEGSYEATSSGVSFNGRTLPAHETFLPLALVVAAPIALSLHGPVLLVRNAWIGIGVFVVLSVAWQLHQLARMGEQVERVLLELAQ